MRLYHWPSVSTHGRYRSAAYHGAKSRQTRIAKGEIGRCNVYQPLGKGEGGTKQVARGAALRCCSEGGTCPMVGCWYNPQPALVRNDRPRRCTLMVTAPRIRGAQLPALQQAGARAGRGQPGRLPRPAISDRCASVPFSASAMSPGRSLGQRGIRAINISVFEP
jgi:hypothetical protein